MIRVAVPAENDEGLTSPICSHFGPAPYFALVDLGDQGIREVQTVSNPFCNQHAPGQVPGFLGSHDADVVLVGGIGARAIAFFEQSGIKTVSGAAGTVEEAIRFYLSGGLDEARPCDQSKEHGGSGFSK